MTPSEIAKIPQPIIDKLVEKFREHNIIHDWWDSTYEGFTVDMTAVGIDVDKMYFSGFWSQGDGACFEGRVTDWELMLQSIGYNDPVLAKFAQDNWTFYSTHSGRYHHSNCMSFNDPLEGTGETEEWLISVYGPEKDDDDLRNRVWAAKLTQFDFEQIHNELCEAFKSHADDLYKMLEDEYEFLTSEECILESLNANDILEDEVKQLTEEFENA